MNPDQGSRVTKVAGAEGDWTLDGLPEVQQAGREVEHWKAVLAQDDARIAGVANDLAQQESRLAALQKESADQLQKWVLDDSHVDARETARVAETAASQTIIPATRARLSALKTARAASAAVKELANAELRYSLVCNAARTTRGEVHRERVTERLVEALLLSYSEMVREGFARAPDKRDPAAPIAALFDAATRDRRVIYSAAERLPSLYGEFSSA